jgi:hypothetical protein
MGRKRRADIGMGYAVALGAPPISAPTIRVLDRVRLTEDVTTEGVTLKTGAEGTAMFKHRPNTLGDAFEVEFSTPIHAVIGVYASKLVRI